MLRDPGQPKTEGLDVIDVLSDLFILQRSGRYPVPQTRIELADRGCRSGLGGLYRSLGRGTLEQADEAYRLLDQQKTGKGVFLPS